MGWVSANDAHHYPNPQRSSPPDLGGELVAVVPAGGLVRARNDCFIALDLDPGNFRLPLFAALLTALEKAHGRFSFSASRTETDTAAVWLAVCGLTLSRRAAGGFSAPLNGANSGNPTGSFRSPQEIPAAWTAAGTPLLDRPAHNRRTGHRTTPPCATRSRWHVRREGICLRVYTPGNPPRLRGASRAQGMSVK